MGKVKNTKTELKAQRDALKRYRRYLPTLLLKKQQLQMEIRQVEQRVTEKRAEEEAARGALADWVKLYSDPLDYLSWLKVEAIDVEPGNIAGVAVRTLREIRFQRTTPDLWATPAWLDEGLATLEQLFRLRIERRLLEEQLRLLAEELRTTSQRVNLFEKVKIPECAENIRRIRIFLGDENTSAVVRSKIAKDKSIKKAAAPAAAVAGGSAA
ncbi:MAG TPA: V-type ATP synthase subunit D [Kiritimatiellia bacterium]|jgi:V/A-type H+-transporting ATPase subunit D|nr:V-type ATP synthase subunit D [Kiritimatiellia bacterium]OQC57785.1 MAG: V-type ATP synthase subunit D [Verrucomicrobia bacterium ADurb.Bin018]MBP9573063.1 V-type ATP synthase subunit D [Kiritimatiellia bacterium]HOE00046.1 V-type ATP synthase subunit D [Kiritimatiellia bacterium]HOE36692.1 V-type ATP synthase subunit D [Kiritimatiellia bacterium]